MNDALAESDPMGMTNLERYCSSYYDRHGLYNDGFPCPADKYCCQLDDGTKMCCSVASLPVNGGSRNAAGTNNNHHHNGLHLNKIGVVTPFPYSSSSSLLNVLSKSNDKLINIHQKSPDSSSSSVSSSILYGSSLPLFLTSNYSTLMISACTALVVLILVAVLILVCACRCLTNKQADGDERQKRFEQNNLLNEHKHKADTAVSSDENKFYCRNSSASSTGTSSTTTSPKTNQLTICCDLTTTNDENEKILLSTSSSSNRSSLINKSMSSGGRAPLSIKNNLNHFATTTYTKLTPSNGGDLRMAALLSSSGNRHLIDYLQSQSACGGDNLADDDSTTTSGTVPMDSNDFIVNTSSNLEFLKAHSLFNTTPLNYYPSLNAGPSATGACRTPNKSKLSTVDEPPPYPDSHLNTTSSTNMTTVTMSSNSQQSQQHQQHLDLRFSTFLPPLFIKNHDFI